MHDDGESSRPPGAFEALFSEYVDLLNEGRGVDKEEIRARAPELADRLLERLESYEFLTGEVGDDSSLGVLGDYVLRRQIGRGGMGIVYEAWQCSVERPVALKVLPARVASDDRTFQRFMREARTAAKLDHPNIVRVHGMGEEEHTPYFAMDLVEGETLAEIVARIRRANPDGETRFGARDQLAYFAKIASAFGDVADGLQHAHAKGVVHRDIKPSNLILDRNGRLRILDFGLARVEGYESLSFAGGVLGTPLYMSPEQARRRKIPLDHRTDVYSLGATLYEVLTDRPPFRGKDHNETLSQIVECDPIEPRKLNPRVPRDLETIVLKCLRKEAADRYGTAEALGQDLRRFVRGDPVEARPESRRSAVARRLRKHRGKALVVGAFGILLCAGAWLWLTGRVADEKRRGLEYGARVREAAILLTSGRFSVEKRGWQSQSVGLPPGVDLHLVIGRFGSRWIRKAKDILEEQVASMPGRLDAHFHLAQAHFLLGETTLATRELARVLEIDPEFVPARVLEKRARRAPAEMSRLSRTRGSSDWRRPWVEARFAEGKKSWGDAANAYTEFLRFRPDPYIGSAIDAYLVRGIARLALGEYERAQEDFSVVRDRAPECLEATLLLAKAYLGAGSSSARSRAEELLETLHAEAEPGDRPEITVWISLLYTSRRNYETALEWAEKLGEAESTAAAFELRSYLARQLGRWEEAAAAARLAVREDGRDLGAWLALGSILANQLHVAGGRAREASLELGGVALRALELEPTNKSARVLLKAAWAALERSPLEDRRKQMIDLRARLASAALALGITLGGVPPGVAQDAEIFDGFDDGSVFDGSPVAWVEECSWSNGIYDATSGDLVVGSNAVTDPVLLAEGPYFEQRVSVRTQIGFRPGATPGVAVFGGCSGSYVLNLRHEEGRFTIRRWDGMLPLTELASAPMPTDFDPEEDHLLQVDIHDDVIEMRVWKPGEPMPQVPTVAATESETAVRYRFGTVGINLRLGLVPPQPGIATYRFFQASSTMITDDVEPEPTFRRGDCNGDGAVDLSDAISTLSSLFLGSGDTPCEDACDANDDGRTDISDPIATLGMLFLGEAALPPPGVSDCGVDPTADEAGCAQYAECR